jgi:hypothetical protein
MSRWQPTGSTGVIARWEIEPLDRSRRGIDERLFLAAPWLLRPVLALATWASPGSRMRRALLGYLLRRGIAANNRGDYEVLAAGLSPDVELHLYPDAPEGRPAGSEPVYHGREGYVVGSAELRTDLADFGWDLRELVDPGGDRIAARVEMRGRGAASGIQTRMTQFHVWQFEHGLLRRQWALNSEAAMLARLEEP